MLNQLTRFVLIASAWKWLKPRWKGLAFLVAVILLVTILHSEYLEYVKISNNNEYVAISYLIKWTALTLAFFSYLVVFAWGKKSIQGDSARNNTTKPDSEKTSAPTDDGFNFLREKEHLENRAEKLIESKGGINGHNDK